MTALPTKEGLMRWVDDTAARDGLDCRETLLMTKFAAYGDADMCSWAKIETLEKQSRSSERKVRYMLRDFEARGYIRRTGRMHTLESGRETPIYAWCGYLDDLGRQENGGRSPAPRAPVESHGGTDDTATGAQGVPPHNEPIEHTLSDERDAGARETDFRRLEAAFPKRGLGFTHRPRAKGEFWRFVDEGGDVAGLIAAAARYGADKTVRRTDLGLDHWLADGKYRGWWPEDGAVGGGSAGAAVGSCPEGETAAWMAVMAQMQTAMGETLFAAWLGRAALGQVGEALFVVAWSETAVAWLKAHRWAELQAAWAARDARPLGLVSRREFEGMVGDGQR